MTPDGQHKALPRHPALRAVVERRRSTWQARLADAITTFAGSMLFVYVHVVLFAVWMLFVERSPWPTLTLVVSLEAIFLSTFVLIGQNRQSTAQQAKADHDYLSNQAQLQHNTEITESLRELAEAIYRAQTAGREKG